jgi:hypothetical protein
MIETLAAIEATLAITRERLLIGLKGLLRAVR